MKTMCPPGYHHNGFVATHTKTYAHLAYVRFEHSVCRGSLMTTIYIYIYIYIHIFFCLFVFFFVGGGDVYGCVCCMYVLVVL